MSLFKALACGLAASLLAGAGVQAQEASLQASPWVQAPSSQVRLILPATAAAAAGGVMHGALEVRLAPGVKTYWRNPGETGVPTTASFDGSRGLSDITLNYPAPGTFDDGAGGTAYGYRDRVTFPVVFRIAPGHAGAPRLAAVLDYGVCTKTMCIPAQAKIDMTLGEGNSAPDLADTVTAALKAVPAARAMGSAEAPALLSVKPEVREGKLRLDMRARVAEGDTSALLIVDGADYYTVGPAEPQPDKTVRFLATSSGDVEAGKPLGAVIVVLVGNGGAIETQVNLDEAAKRP